MKVSRKIVSLLLAALICFSALPMATGVAADDLGYETTTEFTTTEQSVTEETTTQYVEPEQTTTTQPETEEETTTQTTIENTTEETTTEVSTTEEPTTQETTTEETITEATTTEPTTQAPVQEEPGRDDIVARMYIYYIQTEIHPIGHCWVYIENLTGKEMTVGLYTVPPYEGVSVGVFCRKDGLGVYYNVEAYSQTTYGMSGQLSMCEELTYDDVEDVTDALIGFLNHWDPFFNCMYFAFKVWNSASDRKLVSLVFPVFGKLQMKAYSHDYNVPMKPVVKSQTFRQKGSGKSAYLKQATDKVLGVV